MFGFGAGDLLLDVASFIAKFIILAVVLIYIQKFYSSVSKGADKGYPPKGILTFRVILTGFAVAIIAANWLPWIEWAGGSYNGFNLAVSQGKYILLVPPLLIICAGMLTWRSSPNSPSLVAPLFVGYAASTILLGLLVKVFHAGMEIGPASISLIVAGVGVFPAVLYAEGMPHPSNKMLYYFINLGKVSFNRAVRYASRFHSLTYTASAVPIGFASAEGVCQGRSIEIYGREGGVAGNKIAVIKTGVRLHTDGIFIARPKAWYEVYLRALDTTTPKWLARLMGDDKRERHLEHLEVEAGGLVISDNYEVVAHNHKQAIEIFRGIKDEIIDLDVDFIALTKEGIYLGYDFSRMRMPVHYIRDKVLLLLQLADAVEPKLKYRPKKNKPRKKAAGAGISR